MLDRIVVIQNNNATEYFYVPPPSSIKTFLKRVVNELKACQEYNEQIQNIKNMLDCECKKIKRGDMQDITPEEAQGILEAFIEKHPIDTRDIRDVIIDAGGVELDSSIPEENFIEALYK